MKQFAYSSIMILIPLLFFSCKKVYTCSCTITSTTTEIINGTDTIPAKTTISTKTQESLHKVRKKDAENDCADLNGSQDFSGYNNTYSCSLQE